MRALALLPIAVTVFVTAWVASLIAGYAGPGSFVGRLITTLGTSLGLNIEPSSTAAYLLGLAIILGAILRSRGRRVGPAVVSSPISTICRNASSPSSIAATRAI